ncbi:hypothetical protein [Lactococcus lactis]
MFKRKRFMALCATTLAGISALGSFAPMATFADVAKAGDTVVTYEGATKPAEWGLSVPSTIKLNEGTCTAQGNLYLVKNCKINIVKTDGSDYSDPQDKTFILKGNMSNDGYLVGKVDTSQKVQLQAKIMDIGDDHEKDDKLINTMGAVLGDELQQENIEIPYKSDGSQKAERYIKFIASKGQLQKAADQLQTSVSWTATEKTS